MYTNLDLLRGSLLASALVLLVASPLSAQTIVLDPGHGGADPGAVGCMGLEESGVVLDVAQRTRVLLEAEGLTVHLTRNDDRAVGLSTRATMANDIPANLFVSIHSNSNAGTPATGTETFIANSASSTSELLGGTLQTEMIAAWGLRDRGLKRAGFTVITSTRMPAALTELAFTNRCDPDAALLRDPSARADAAAAHARAILITLGMDPPPVGTTGVLRGVVFEDRGAGLEDTSIRLDTARVTIDGMERAVDAETGHFFVNLAPGSYPVLATAPGFEPATRTCAVTGGGETWCSIGLRVEGSPPPPVDSGPGSLDAGTPTPDAGTPPPPPTGDAGAPPPPESDSGTPVGPPGTDRPGDSGGCSVSAHDEGSGHAPAVLLFALMGLLVWRRSARSRHVGAAVLGLLALGCGEVPEATVASVVAAAPDTAPVIATPRLEVTSVAHLASLTDVAPVAEGLRAPVLSADGERIAMSTADQSELWLHEEDTVEQLAVGPRVGYRPRFVGSTLRYRHADQSGTAVPHHAISLDGERVRATSATAWVHVDAERRVVLRRQGQGAEVISPEGDRYMVPELSADERHVVFWGVATGLHLYRVEDGAHAALGDGGHPSFDPTGRWLVHDRTSDDGHDLVGGTLFLMDLTTYRRAPIETAASLAYQPSLAAGRLAFTTEEGVVVGQLQLD
ncbi:MAG: N-acetylmuramoyl-L-alanine amidase [Sandaracinaceae bacterium]